MTSINAKTASRRLPGYCLAAMAMLVSAAPASALVQSWNNYRWARSGPLQITVGDNLTGYWAGELDNVLSQWSQAAYIDLVAAPGKAKTTACSPTYGSIQVCNGNYGKNGWLGYANVWTSGGFIVQATVRLNDYYLAAGGYATEAWRDMTICQEVGHTLGLDHNNAAKTDANKGTCMDYTNDPSGLKGTNGTLANTMVSFTDIAALDANYAIPAGNQLSHTKPKMLAGSGLFIDGDHVEMLAAVPEPQSWALLIAGFGLVGAMQRRRRIVAA